MIAYIVQSTSTGTDRYDLDTRILTLNRSEWQCDCGEGICSVASDVEDRATSQRNVENWVVSSETEVHEDVGPWMMEVQAERPSSERPESTVCSGGLVDVGAYEMSGCRMQRCGQVHVQG